MKKKHRIKEKHIKGFGVSFVVQDSWLGFKWSYVSGPWPSLAAARDNITYINSPTKPTVYHYD